MNATKIWTVEMVRRIRDRQARSLARKSNAEVVAFFRDAGEAAMKDVRQRAKTLRRKAG